MYRKLATILSYAALTIALTVNAAEACGLITCRHAGAAAHG